MHIVLLLLLLYFLFPPSLLADPGKIMVEIDGNTKEHLIPEADIPWIKIYLTEIQNPRRAQQGLPPQQPQDILDDVLAQIGPQLVQGGQIAFAEKVLAKAQEACQEFDRAATQITKTLPKVKTLFDVLCRVQAGDME